MYCDFRNKTLYLESVLLYLPFKADTMAVVAVQSGSLQPEKKTLPQKQPVRSSLAAFLANPQYPTQPR